MNKAFEKILERLDSYIEDAKSEGDFSYIKPFEIAKRVVQEVAEEYTSTEHINYSTNASTDDWIPIKTRPMTEEEREYYSEFLDEDNGLIYECPFIAWQPLPQPYKGGENL